VQPIFVGDVQGCADELNEMIGRGDAEFGSEWVLWLVGDLVNRGPANRRVLESVRDRVERGRARLVLGNHDVAFLRAHYGLSEPGPYDTLADLLDHPDSGEWADWLRRQPLLAAGELGARKFLMVHAAVDPVWDWAEAQSQLARVEAELRHDEPDHYRALLTRGSPATPEAERLGRVTRCRSVGPGDRWSASVPDAGSGEVPWHVRWSERHHDYGIVYGHWALQGLHVAPGLRGLDTGCVHHGRDHEGFLTAWVPDMSAPDPFAVSETHFWQVRARRRYYQKDP